MSKKPKKKRHIKVYDVGYGSDKLRLNPLMAHTFDTKVKIPTAANTTTNANPASGTVTLAADVTLLVIGIIYNGVLVRNGGAPTANGVALTQAGTYQGVTEASCELWYLTTGTQAGLNVIVVPNAPTAKNLDIFVSSYIAQTGYISVLDNFTGTATTSINPGIFIDTTVAGDVIVGVCADGVNAWNPSSPSGTVIYNEDPATWGGGAQYILTPDIRRVDCRWDETNDDWGVVAAAFKEVASGPPPTDITVTDAGQGTDEISPLSASLSASDAGQGNDTFEYPPDPFPIISVLDNFNRASLGSNWTIIRGSPAIVDNQFKGITSGTNSAMWNVSDFGPAIEFYATINGITGSSDLAYFYYSISGTVSSGDYYELFASSLSPINCQLRIYKKRGGIQSLVLQSDNLPYSSRDNIKVGVRHRATGEITLYIDRGSGWEEVARGNDKGALIKGPIELDLFSSFTSPPILSYDDIGAGTLSYSEIFAFDSITDIGQGTDTINVLQLASKIVSDIASAVDNLSIAATLSTSENANGQDTLSLQIQLSLADTSVGIDNPVIANALGITDGALGGDFLDLSASISVSEAGNGLDALLQLLASLSLPDLGSGGETPNISASLSVVDSGSGSDVVNLIVETILKSISDAGLGSDQISISVSLSVADVGAGNEALVIQVSLQVLDTGIGTDALSLLTGTLKQIADLASGSETLSVSASLNVGETTYGIDDPAVQVALGLADVGGGLESPQISASLIITDTSAGTDLISILQATLKTVQELATGTDAISSITASIPVAESGLGSDQIGQLLASLLVTDFGAGVEVIVKFDSSSDILKIEFVLNSPKIITKLTQPTISIALMQPVVKFSLKTQ